MSATTLSGLRAASASLAAPRVGASPRARVAPRHHRRGAATIRAMAGYDDAGNPIGRDTTFGRLAGSSSLQTAPASAASFWGKVKAAFAIFFPPSEEETARLEAKKRLRMILVADRCAMSGRAMAEMKRQIVDVVQTFVDVDEEAGVEMSTTQDPGSSGTLYSVSIPVRGGLIRRRERDVRVGGGTHLRVGRVGGGGGRDGEILRREPSRTADQRTTTRERRSERSRATEDIRPEVHESAKREGEEEEGVVGP